MAAVDLARLGSETRGVLLAFVVLDAGESACANFAAREREGLLEAWRALGRLAEGEREGLCGKWRAELASGLPSGFESLHPSWVADALAAEPPYLVERLHEFVPGTARNSEAEPRQASPVSGSDLTHLAFGHLVPLCEDQLGPLASRLCTMPFDTLVDEVTRMGARTLGRSLVGSDAGLRSRAMAMAGLPWSDIIGQTLGEAISDEERQAAAVHVAGAVDKAARTPSDRLLRIGLRALAAELSAEHPGSLTRVAGRLPVTLGRLLLEW